MLRSSFPQVAIRDAGYGYDTFGLSAKALVLAFAAAWPLYRHYFRVTSSGTQHIPLNGKAIIVANHSGMLPFDAMMLCMDVAQHTQRVLRPLVDHLVSGLPFVNTMLQRVGAVGGTTSNARALLTAGEALLIFPEGIAGISKPRSHRYELSQWRPGHAELALREHVPIIPAAVIGAEDQFPIVHNSKRLGRLVGAPHVPLSLFPVPIVPIPLPVKYQILYGEPILLDRSTDADDPRAVDNLAWQTRTAVLALVRQGVRERKGMFS